MKEFNEEEILKYVRSNKIYGTLGSEGMVYKVGDDAIKLLKRVKGEEFMASKEEKVDALIKNPIEGFSNITGKVFNDEGEFVGYSMDFIENKGDVADMCYKFAEHYTLDKKIEFLKKTEELIKKAHSLGYILNDVAIWNFLVTESNDVIGIDTDNFQFDKFKSETTPTYFLPYYQGLTRSEGRDENSDKFSFGLFAFQALMQYPFTNEGLETYRPKSDYLNIHINRLDIPQEAKDELLELISPNKEKEWVSKTLEKMSSSTSKFLYL